MGVERLFSARTSSRLGLSSPRITSEQRANLEKWDGFISNLNTRPMTWKEKWEAIDQKFRNERNRQIGWKSKK